MVKKVPISPEGFKQTRVSAEQVCCTHVDAYARRAIFAKPRESYRGVESYHGVES